MQDRYMKGPRRQILKGVIVELVNDVCGLSVVLSSLPGRSEMLINHMNAVAPELYQVILRSGCTKLSVDGQCI